MGTLRRWDDMKSEPTYEVTIKWVFKTKADRAQLVHELQQSPDRIFLSRVFKTRHTACKLCGIPASFGTLGFGVVPGSETDQCRPAFDRACARNQKNRKYLDE